MLKDKLICIQADTEVVCMYELIKELKLRQPKKVLTWNYYLQQNFIPLMIWALYFSFYLNSQAVIKMPKQPS